jgi:hypothetical protein
MKNHAALPSASSQGAMQREGRRDIPVRSASSRITTPRHPGRSAAYQRRVVAFFDEALR